MPSDLPAGMIPMSDALGEADTSSLSELFNRNPESLQDADIAAIAAEFRAQRERFAQAEAAPKLAKPKATALKAASLVAKLNAEDLGL